MSDIHSARWKRLSRYHRRNNPLCAECLAHGIVTPAQVVDHIVPRAQRPDLTWEPSNWQSLCTSCHNGRKQIIEHKNFSKDIGIDGWPTHPNHPANRKNSFTGG